MASLNLAGKTSGYVKLQAPDDSSNNPTVTLPTESGELALKSDIGEGGDSLWTEENGVAVYGGSLTTKGPADTNVNIEAPSGKYASFIVDNADQKYSMQIRPDVSNAFVIRNETSGQNTMTLGTDGRVDITGSLYVNGDPKSVDSMLVDLEKDVKLKDKLIEKLSERLDKLEKKLKK